MKPRLKRTPGVPGISSPQWWCIGDGALGYGNTPAEAYCFWVGSQMDRAKSALVWLQQPAPKPLNRFQRWILQCGDWH